MKVIKVYCVDVKSDIGKAPVVGWLVGFKENTNICTI